MILGPPEKLTAIHFELRAGWSRKVPPALAHQARFKTLTASPCSNPETRALRCKLLLPFWRDFIYRTLIHTFAFQRCPLYLGTIRIRCSFFVEQCGVTGSAPVFFCPKFLNRPTGIPPSDVKSIGSPTFFNRYFFTKFINWAFATKR